jgi:USP6 N-terminal-like protein
MHKNFNKSSIREKLRRRIFKGIPDSLRGAIWQKLLGIDEKMNEHPDTYKNMLKIGHKYSTDIRQIDNDINRHETSI